MLWAMARLPALGWPPLEHRLVCLCHVLMRVRARVGAVAPLMCTSRAHAAWLTAGLAPLQIKRLVSIIKTKRVWFVADELGQHDKLVYRVHSHCQTDCWEVYAGADTFTTTQQMMLQGGMLPVCPATTAMRARILPDAVDRVASRMRRWGRQHWNAHACMCACVRACMHVCVHVRVCVCACACVHAGYGVLAHVGVCGTHPVWAWVGM